MRSLHFFRWVNCSVVPGVKPGKRKTEVSVAAAFRHVSDFYGYRISRMASTTQVRCGYDLGTHQVRFHKYRITQGAGILQVSTWYLLCSAHLSREK